MERPTLSEQELTLLREIVAKLRDMPSMLLSQPYGLKRFFPINSEAKRLCEEAMEIGLRVKSDFLASYACSLVILDTERTALADDIQELVDEQSDGGPWSRPDSPSHWAKVWFNCCPDTFKTRCENGTYRVKKESERRYRIHVGDLPASHPDSTIARNSE